VNNKPTYQELENQIVELKEKNKILRLDSSYQHEKEEKNDREFRHMIASMRVGVLLQGPKAEILISNSAALEMLGLSEDQLLGKTSFDPEWNVIHEDGSPFPGHTHPVPEAIAKCRPIYGVIMGVYHPIIKDHVWLLVDAIPHVITNNKVEKIVCTFINITELKKAEQTLRKSETQLKLLNTTKDTLFSIIAHDLRNPFNSILGFSKLLIEKANNLDPSKSEKYLNIINSSANNTLILLENLLNWAQCQTGEISFHPKTMIFSNVIQEVLKIEKSIAKTKSITLNYSSSDEIEVYADENMLKTVLRNLVSNAIKFTKHEGNICVFAILKQGQIEITISDNGIGINEKKLKDLFNTATTTHGTANEKGSGLGLMLCKEFVKIHKGEIWVKSKEGNGSDFKFTLPLDKS
jgi:two-component system sensor histidine kinase/response regulator